MTYRIRITPVALAMLESLKDRRIRRTIRNRIDGLARDPDQQGKPLTGELSGYRSLRTVGQRYRIIYRIERDTVTVLVVALGIRKAGSKSDIYELARKLLQQHRLESPDE